MPWEARADVKLKVESDNSWASKMINYYLVVCWQFHALKSIHCCLWFFSIMHKVNRIASNDRVLRGLKFWRSEREMQTSTLLYHSPKLWIFRLESTFNHAYYFLYSCWYIVDSLSNFLYIFVGLDNFDLFFNISTHLTRYLCLTWLIIKDKWWNFWNLNVEVIFCLRLRKTITEKDRLKKETITESCWLSYVISAGFNKPTGCFIPARKTSITRLWINDQD